MVELNEKIFASIAQFSGNGINAAQIIDLLPVAIYTCDADGFVTHYNNASVELWGSSPKIGVQMWCGSWRIYKPNGLPMPLHECPMAIALKEKRAVTGEEIIVERVDGTRRNIEPYPIPLFNENGELTGAVNMLVDVTDRKIAEEKSALLAAIVQSSDDAIVSKTLGSLVTSWNHAAEKMFGYSAAEMIGESITKIIPGERLSEEDLILSKIRQGERIEHFITQRQTKDKKLIDISLTVSPVKNKYGDIIGASKIARDISTHKHIERLLRESEEHLKSVFGSNGHS
jgi:PAS domain S-box-containing protein